MDEYLRRRREDDDDDDDEEGVEEAMELPVRRERMTLIFTAVRSQSQKGRGTGVWDEGWGKVGKEFQSPPFLHSNGRPKPSKQPSIRAKG
jgi:hypothetical protein